MKSEKDEGARGGAPLLEAWWAKGLAALWLIGAAAAHYWLWVRVLAESALAPR